MKRAAAADARRRVHLRKATDCPVFVKLSLKNLDGFIDLNYEPNSSCFAICGATGVGKSSVLDLIAFALKPHYVKEVPDIKNKYGKPIIDLHIATGSGDYSQVLDCGLTDRSNNQGLSLEHIYVPVQERTEVILQIFDEIDPYIAIEGVEPKFFNDKDVLLASRVIGKSYRSVSCYETEDPDFADAIIPFFVIEEHNICYDTRDMGTGELSAIYLIWLFEFVKRQSILLVEEPEAMLPPSSHLELLDALCAKALERQLSFVIATHSPEMIAGLPLKQVLSLDRFDAKSSYSNHVQHKSRLLSSLGLKVPKVGLILVEDQLAFTVAHELLAQFDLDLMKRVEIQKSGGGFGGIKVALEALPDFDAIKVIGLLDGDMQSVAIKWACATKCFFLPSSVSMEAEFIEAIRHDMESFSQRVNRDLFKIRFGLSRAQGVDAHDGFANFCDEVGISIQTCATISFSQWLKIFSKSDVCIELTQKIRQSVISNS